MANSVIRGFAVMLIGVLLLFWSESVVHLLIRVLGAAFLLPALVSLVNVYLSRWQGNMFPKVLVAIVDLGSVAFGVWLLVSPAGFVNLVVKILALLLLLFAVYRVALLVMAQKVCAVSLWMYIVPLVLVVASIMLFVSTFSMLATLSVLFGIVVTVSGLSDILTSLLLRKRQNGSGMAIVK